ncbi:MAG: T9SS type A sorting domain-containing protein, partial [Bacteroidetes bacterium]|nr:T9SS type A sorting domain-containing protein [Bacteroidota bacterium]
IDGHEQEILLKIYPNPSSGTFTVAVPETASRPDKMLITDLSGKKIFSYSPDKQAAEFSINPMLSKGLYVLLFEIEGRQHSRKLILK